MGHRDVRPFWKVIDGHSRRVGLELLLPERGVAGTFITLLDESAHRDAVATVTFSDEAGAFETFSIGPRGTTVNVFRVPLNGDYEAGSVDRETALRVYSRLADLSAMERERGNL